VPAQGAGRGGGTMRTSSEKVGLLLAHFFLGDREALSVSGAARLSGLRAAEARVLLELLAREGLLCRSKTSRRGTFRAATGAARYKRCRKAFCGQRNIN